MSFILKPVFLFSKIVSEIAKDIIAESDSDEQDKKSNEQSNQL